MKTAKNKRQIKLNGGKIRTFRFYYNTFLFLNESKEFMLLNLRVDLAALHTITENQSACCNSKDHRLAWSKFKLQWVNKKNSMP